MKELTNQLYALLNGLWHYGATIAQLSAITNTSERQVARALGNLYPILDYRLGGHSPCDSWVPQIVWFLKPRTSDL